jgi:glycolate oxidase subunit GlcD
MALDKDQKNKIEMALPSERVFFNFEEKPEYTHDATELVFMPDVLFFAETEAEIVTAVKLCREMKIPLIVRGAGTGYSGGALAINGGLLVSIERLDSLKIDAHKKTATVGPGVITADVMKAAEARGLFYPPDPASYEESTIGGNLAENAGGLRCKKYGVTKDYVLSVRGIDSTGEIIEIGLLSPFGLTDVLIGSEGTLFVFTEITLRLIDLPRPGKTIQATFAKAVDAASVVAEVTAAGIVPCIMEFMDGDAIECSNIYDPEHRIDGGAAMLLFETDGANAVAEAESIMAICRKHSPLLLSETADTQEREILWKTRRNLSHAVKQAAEAKISEDVCVPPSRLPELVALVEELGRKLSVRVNCYGHAGDGNLHVNFLGMTGSEQEEKEIEEGIEALFHKTLELGGTLSGEHGIGITKKDYLHQEFDESTLRFMKRLEKRLNPDSLLNPGKIFL